jgi:ribosome-binding protein aMBF1 (putative translation factor)
MTKILAISGIITLASSLYYNAQTTNAQALLAPSKINYDAFGKQLRIARERKQITRAALASAVNIEEDRLKLIENGRIIPTKDLVYQFESILQTTLILN